MRAAKNAVIFKFMKEKTPQKLNFFNIFLAVMGFNDHYPINEY